jgi:hypothetical protein
LISAARREGKTQRIEILAEKGGRCRLVSPFDGKEILLEMKPGERKVLTAAP